MSVLVVGLSHRTAPVAVLEGAVVPTDLIPLTLKALQRADSVREAILVSTCNRVEVYAEADNLHSTVAEITSILAKHARLSISDLSSHLYVHSDATAVEHVFTVAAGLDSVFVGEAQILGQLRSAYALGIDLGTVGKVLHELLQTAFHVGKRVHAETGIDRVGASVVAGALDRAEQVLGQLSGKRIVIVGAGSMGALAGATLRLRGVNDIVVLNRSPERAARLAATLDGAAAPLTELQATISTADVLIASTGSTDVVVDAQMVTSRNDRPLVVLDLARPHDVDPSIARQPGVTYFDLEALHSASPSASVGDVRAAERIVAAELIHYRAAVEQHAVASIITALHAQAKRIVEAELERLDARIPNLPDHQRDAVRHTVRRAIEKIIHSPTVRVKELATAPGGERYAVALCELFDLRPEAAGSAVPTSSSTGLHHVPCCGSAGAAWTLQRAGLVGDGAASPGRVQQEPNPGFPGRGRAACVPQRVPVRAFLPVVPARSR